MMGGLIDWAGLPVIFELLGVTDTERTLRQMITICDCCQQRQSQG